MSSVKLPPLRELDFGRLEAMEESREAPELLRDGYFDFNGAALNVALGATWVLVGAKGAGKSAAIAHLDLLWTDAWDKFLGRWDLGSYPIADVTTLQVGTLPGPSSSRAAWEFLLLLRLFESLMRDEGASYSSEITKLRRELRTAGLIEGPDLRTKFNDWASTTFKFSVGMLEAENDGATSPATVVQLIEILRRALAQISTRSQHLIAIDGLDSFFAQSETQLESLAALVDASREINVLLRDCDHRSSIVLAVRAEMFLNLPSTDSAKLKDHAIELDWSKGIPAGDDLWHLINGKVKASVLRGKDYKPLRDIRTDYFSTPFSVASYDSMSDYFLAHTRLLPRDLIALMREVQTAHPGSEPVTTVEARAAVRAYCDSYFVREISDNLGRILPGASAIKVGALIDALSSLSSRRFKADDLMPELDEVMTRSELRILLKQLFQVGAIGVRQGSGPHKNTNFIFRRQSGGGFSFLAEFTIHNALVEAWNLPWA
jgi:hypothetical protein